MDHKFKDMTVIRQGASNGDGTVIGIELVNGTQIPVSYTHLPLPTNREV